MPKILVDSPLFDHVDLTPTIRHRLWFLMQQNIDAILDDFYGFLQNSAYAQLLKSVDVESIKTRQISHWQHVITQGIDAEYSIRVTRMHETHLRIGLSNRHYITAYMYLLNKFEKTILMHAAGPKEAFSMISALHAIFADDIARALEVDYV